MEWWRHRQVLRWCVRDWIRRDDSRKIDSWGQPLLSVYRETRRPASLGGFFVCCPAVVVLCWFFFPSCCGCAVRAAGQRRRGFGTVSTSAVSQKVSLPDRLTRYLAPADWLHACLQNRRLADAGPATGCAAGRWRSAGLSLRRPGFGQAGQPAGVGGLFEGAPLR